MQTAMLAMRFGELDGQVKCMCFYTLCCTGSWVLVQKVEAMEKQISERKVSGKRWWGRNEPCARSRLFTFNVVLCVDPLCGSVSLNSTKTRRPSVQHPRVQHARFPAV